MANSPIRRGGATNGRAWQLALFTCLAIVVFILVIVALLPPNRGANPAGANPDAAAPSNSPPSTTVPPVSQGVTEFPTRLIVAVNETSAWRATSGACDGAAAAVEFTTDGGVSWVPSTSIPALGDFALATLRRGVDGSITSLGLQKPGCEPQVLVTSGRADKWKLTTGAATEWFVVANPDGSSSVNSPTGAIQAPCERPVAISAVSAVQAGALCSDQTFYRTLDGGLTWDDGIVIAGAQGVTASVESYLLPSVGRAACAGVQLVIAYPQTAPADGASAGCRQLPNEPTEVALSVVGDNLWLWTDDDVSVTIDRGVTWR